jgi:hypothetical protein
MNISSGGDCTVGVSELRFVFGLHAIRTLLETIIYWMRQRTGMCSDFAKSRQVPSKYLERFDSATTCTADGKTPMVKMFTNSHGFSHYID